MAKIRKLFLLSLLLLAMGSVWNCFAQAKKATGESKIVAVPATSVRPAAGFSIGFRLIPRLSMDASPVKMTALKSDAPLMLSNVEVENLSAKEVQSVRFDWYLFEGLTSKSVIKQGRTKLVKTKNFQANEKKLVKCPLPSFDQMFSSLTKNGYISGKYFVEPVVGEVVYADGTKWQRDDKANPDKATP